MEDPTRTTTATAATTKTSSNAGESIGAQTQIRYVGALLVCFVLIMIGENWIGDSSIATAVGPNSTNTMVKRSSVFTRYTRILRNEQKKWIEGTMYQQYGKDAFEKIFIESNNNINNSSSNYYQKLKWNSFEPVSSKKHVSTNRLRRKLQIKLLQNQLYLNASLVWVTGGHSAAAAHGNLYSESYTAVLERDLQQVLNRTGIPFVARNYAMGGSGSGPELGLCVEQVYGTDVDFLSWDFGMTDVYSPVRILLYAIRANLLPHHPPIFALRADSEGRIDLLKEAEKMGISSFVLPESVQKRQRDNIPETTLENYKKMIKKAPPMIRAFKCSTGIETGEPACDDEKYSHYECVDRTGKASWHPGYKSHALDGHTIALFLVQEIIKATEDLAIQLEGYQPPSSGGLRKLDRLPSPEEFLWQLQAQEREDFERFQAAKLPEMASQVHKWHKCDKETLSETEKDIVAQECSEDASFDQYSSVFFKGPGICHTARLPSHTRYNGYVVNNTNKVGKPVPAGKETYETGVDMDKAPVDSLLKLAYRKNERDDSCPVTLNPDYKDFFYAHEQDGWAKLTMPNKAEKEAYSYDIGQFQGLIGISFLTCPWNRCPKGFVGTKRDFDDGKFEITINGSPVESLILFQDVGSYFLKGPDGYLWKPKSDTKDYEIAMRVVEDGSHVEVSSFILY